jgi:hypothetical protein
MGRSYQEVYEIPYCQRHTHLRRHGFYMTGAMDRGADLGAFLLVAGFSCELLFWTRVLRIKKRQKVATE